MTVVVADMLVVVVLDYLLSFLINMFSSRVQYKHNQTPQLTSV